MGPDFIAMRIFLSNGGHIRRDGQLNLLALEIFVYAINNVTHCFHMRYYHSKTHGINKYSMEQSNTIDSPSQDRCGFGLVTSYWAYDYCYNYIPGVRVLTAATVGGSMDTMCR